MKWGVRQKQQRARARSKEFERKFPTSKARTQEIFRARKQTHREQKAFERAKDLVEKEKARKVFLNNPDRATAMRLTEGEKWTLGLIAGILGPSVVPSLAIGGATAYRVRQRHRIEEAQARGRIR